MIIKDIPGYEGLYQITDTGQVIGLKKNVMKKPHIEKDGFYRLSLSKKSTINTFYIHSLVAMAFIPNPNNFHFVYHKDGNKLNNNSDNLVWVKTSPYRIRHDKRKYSIEQVRGALEEYRKYRKFYKSFRVYAEKYNKSLPTIYDMVKRGAVNEITEEIKRDREKYMNLKDIVEKFNINKCDLIQIYNKLIYRDVSDVDPV